MVMAFPSPIDAVVEVAAADDGKVGIVGVGAIIGEIGSRAGGGGDIPRRPGNRFKIAAGGGARYDGSDGRRPSKERRREGDDDNDDGGCGHAHLIERWRVE